MEKKRIYAQRQGTLSAEERVKLAELLIRAGYSVRLTRIPAKTGKTYVHAVEYWTDDVQTAEGAKGYV